MTGKDRRVAIVGAGVGGLAAAILLAARGCAVSVFERAPVPGGKLRAVEVGGATLDAGPTLLTLRPIFEAIFAAGGSSLEAHLSLTEAQSLGRHVWPDGSCLDLHRDEARTADAIGTFAGAAEARGYREFCARARRVRQTLDAAFLQRPRPTALGLAAEVGMARLLGLSPFALLDDALAKHFRDPRLRQLFGGYATYVGASPLRAPATLIMVAAVEQEGVWRVAGGVHRLAQELAVVAEGMGVALHCKAPVAELLVEGGRAAGLRLADGAQVQADAVVVNADVAALGAGLFGAHAARAVDAVAPRQRSFSAVTWAIRGRLTGRPALHTNIVFPKPGGEYADLGFRARLPAASTLHLTAQDRGDEPVAPGGMERILVTMSAPARGDGPPLDVAALTQSRLAQLAAAGFEVEATPGDIHTTTPAGFEALFPGTGGALYGPALHGWNAAFERPRAATRLPGLFLAGGGTHPGAGLGMAALSGRFAAEAVLEERR
jgi:1-hydroxycarotenoid 3,4-desaturase